MVDGDVNQGLSVGWVKVLLSRSICLSLKEGWEPQGML